MMEELFNHFHQYLCKDIFVEKKQASISILKQHPEMIEQVLLLSFSEKYPENWRSAWVVDGYFEKYPDKLIPHLPFIIQSLPNIKEHGVRRQMLRTISRCKKLPDKNLGLLVDICFDWLLLSDSPPAVKAHCMQILYNISYNETDLRPELITAIESQLDTASVGVKNRSHKLLTKLYGACQ